MKNCIRPRYEKLKPLKSGFVENSIFENNRDPWEWEGGQGKVLQPEYEMSQQTLTTKGYLKSCHQVVVSTFNNHCHIHSSSLVCSHLNDKLGVPFQMYISQGPLQEVWKITSQKILEVNV